MPVYNYVALKNNKDVVRGKVEAENHKEARSIIRKMSLLPTQISEDVKASSGVIVAKKCKRCHCKTKLTLLRHSKS